MIGSPGAIGVIGLGSMGLPMAYNLLRAHGSLVVHSRSPRPELVAAGATWAENPRELAERVDAVLLMLPDLPDIRATLEGPDGLLAANRELLLLVAATASPSGVRELADELTERFGGRVRVVDCPVSGGVEGAHAGTLSIMLGGSEADCDEAAALLTPCGTPVRLGPLGAGQVAKACNQLVVSATMLALGEATVLAERSGIDLELMWSVLGRGYAGSRLLETKREKLVTGDDSPTGVAQYMVKDLRFAGDVASATRTNAALLPALQAAFDEIVTRGMGGRDIAVTRRFVAER